MPEKADCIYYDMCALRTLTREDMVFLGMADNIDCHCEVCDEYDNLKNTNTESENYYENNGFRYPERRSGKDRRAS